ncbi:antA/AntB antirepressor family protein [Glaesserella parasuis]|uniref:antA/AntB antirepressor family protein n=1 Tax=Glaesserella parasuis TaxID=738 RepID=UPI003B680904
MNNATALTQLLAISTQNFNDHTLNSINARNLYQALGVKRDFTAWIKARIKQGQFIENIDFFVLADVVVENNLSSPKRGNAKSKNMSLPHLASTTRSPKARPQKANAYIISLDMAKHLCLMEKNEQGRAIRQHFINAEKQLARSQPKTYRNTLAETKARLNAIDHNHALNEAINEWQKRNNIAYTPNHYRNEAEMLDGIVLGQNVRKWKRTNGIKGNVRDYFTPNQLEQIALLAEADKTLLRLNLPYHERKAKLTALAKQHGK